MHRPQFDDWSLPKGKVAPGELAATCAVREVEEETGVRIRLTVPLDPHGYWVGNRAKKVLWWVAEPVSTQHREPDDEVDTVLWIAVEQALNMLSYANEVERLRQALEQPRVTTLLILRHGQAMQRGSWKGQEPQRPLTNRGRGQSRTLIPLLKAFGIQRLVSSPARRCVATLTPYAEEADLTIETISALTQESGTADSDGVTEAMTVLREEVADSGTPTAVCGHRPVLPTMLAATDLPNHTYRTADCVVVTLTSDNEVHSAEWYRHPRGV